ncbi:fatty acid synthase-like isoform X2 [Daktulosphaira vitifoliae]|uniref:fatty acid synthase-like isoform X2 n=1 Tax=Daktulosphaira vitifoliae TaxID=58002 RepID=UPI0021AADDB2|nr:fatty acid synthase-like isoform X2 [Daktulosphaira vitifoliae]
MDTVKEEVVISGIGGIFPQCANAEELKTLLFSKTNGVTLNTEKWSCAKFGAASSTGKVKNSLEFDGTFFKSHPLLSDATDPLLRLTYERAIEAIIDAGLNPSDLRGTNTGVFTGIFISEYERSLIEGSQYSGLFLMGTSKAMQSNRISYILDVVGPSFTLVSGWSSGAIGLTMAKNLIEGGFIDSAIVGVSNLVLQSELQLQYKGLNKLTQTGATKSFSANADGYNRSEAVVVLYLQKASNAKRSYGTLLNIKSTFVGDHNGFIVERSIETLRTTIVEAYKEVNVDPTSIEYIEANGSGVKDEDHMELKVLDEIFCTNQRKTPLKIGSVKSNIGNTEEVGLFSSIVKAIIIFESGSIPPNINYSEPYPDVISMKKGKMQVVTDPMPFTGDMIGITAFGILNNFTHVILKKHNNINQLNMDKNDLPSLIIASGRNEVNVTGVLNKILSNENKEYISLTRDIFSKNMSAHFYRGFTILSQSKSNQNINIKNVTLQKRPIWFVFSGMGSQWLGMGADLMNLPIFAESIRKSHAVLQLKGIDLINIITSEETTIFDNILNSFVGIAAIQIALVDILNALEVVPNGIIGHSAGELGCAYADGCLTAEEMIYAAYARGLASIETDLIPGMMAAIGLGYMDIKNRVPSDIDIACHNNSTNCTISGPTKSVNKFVDSLKAEGIFAKAINVANIAYHSRYIKPAFPALLKYLKEVIKEPKQRSSKWISSSVPESQWESELAKTSSAEYLTNNLLSSVLFEEATRHIPKNAVVIEIAPRGLLQAILKRSLNKSVKNISLTKNVKGESINILFEAIGEMYTHDINPNINALYPSVKYPVNRGTPFLHDLPLWDYSVSWTIYSKLLLNETVYREGSFPLSLNINQKLIPYKINGHNILPLSYLLNIIWTKFVEFQKNSVTKPIVFNNIKVHKNIAAQYNSSSDIYYMIQNTGYFEFNHNDAILLSGYINFFDSSFRKTTSLSFSNLNLIENTMELFLTKNELYTFLEQKGYNLGKNFKTIDNVKLCKNFILADIKWKNDWFYFLDALLKIKILENLDISHAEIEESIHEIIFYPEKFKNCEKKNINVFYNTLTKEVMCNGVLVSNITNKKLKGFDPIPCMIKLETKRFDKNSNLIVKDLNNFIDDCIYKVHDEYQKDSIRIPVSKNGLTIKYLGLNHKSTVIDDSIEDELGPVEYSGITKNGKAVMGILSCIKSKNEMIYEDILTWPVPETWSLENAVTVPLAYSMAYYLFNILGKHEKLNPSVLITSGMHPIGQAAISICLYQSYNVFVVVENEKQAKIISEQNPSLPRSNIIINDDNTFDIKMKMLFKTEINYVLNFLDKTGLDTSANIIANNGKIYNFSFNVAQKNENIGSRVFINNVSMHNLNNHKLLVEIDKNKCIIRDLIINGLHQGVIKPLKNFILESPSNTLSYKKVFNTIRNLYLTSEKLILPINDNIMKSGYVELQADECYKCLPNQVYVIIGNKNGWLEITEWLVQRGAQKINIVINKMILSSMECRKFNQLLSKNISIKIETDLFTKPEEEIYKWFNHLTESNNLGGLFLVEQDSYDNVKKFSQVFENLSKKSDLTPFICIACKCENLCADLKSKGLNVLNINWNTLNIKNNRFKLMMLLDSLLIKPDELNSCTYELTVDNAKNSYQKTNHLLTYDELQLSTINIGNEVDFIEVQTRSPKYSHVKGNSAIFFIPGFKSKYSEKFYNLLMYPTFEARFPESIESINHLAQSLVKKLKQITNKNFVSLIGESWGGIVALKMAQILESEEIIVSVSLLYGDPYNIIERAKEVMNNYKERQLKTNNTSVLNKTNISFDLQKSQIYELLSNKKNPKEMENINIVLSIFKAIIDSEPLKHKVLARIQIFVHEITSDVLSALNDYIFSSPFLYEVKKSDSNKKHCLDDIFRKINDNVAFYYGDGDQLSLQEKYNNINFKFEALKLLA